MIGPTTAETHGALSPSEGQIPRTAFLRRHWWHCWSCQKGLGQREPDGRVLIKNGSLRVRALLPLDRQCERCDEWNRLDA
jgi:hypothetical protein